MFEAANFIVEAANYCVYVNKRRLTNAKMPMAFSSIFEFTQTCNADCENSARGAAPPSFPFSSTISPALISDFPRTTGEGDGVEGKPEGREY